MKAQQRAQRERGWHRCFREMEKLLNFVPPETLTRWKDFIRVSSPVVALEHAAVIDGTGAPAKQDQIIVLSDGRITALGPSGSIEVPANAKRLDLIGYTALPGLVDMHAIRVFEKAADIGASHGAPKTRCRARR